MSRIPELAVLAATAFVIAGCSGPPGPAGPAGPAGPEGPAGPPGGLSGYEIVVGESVLDATPSKQLQVDCPTGKRATGAGWSVSPLNADAVAETLQHASQPETWDRAARQVAHWQRHGQSSCAEMADAYWALYERVCP